jgi:hypothetical protein
LFFRLNSEAQKVDNIFDSLETLQKRAENMDFELYFLTPFSYGRELHDATQFDYLLYLAIFGILYICVCNKNKNKTF